MLKKSKNDNANLMQLQEDMEKVKEEFQRKLKEQDEQLKK